MINYTQLKMAEKKKLLPRSAVFIKKYERQLRLLLVGVVATLTILFIFHGSNNVESAPAQTKPASNAKSSSMTDSVAKNEYGISPVKKTEYAIPFTDMSQGVVKPPRDGKKVSAAFVSLVRNKDLWSMANSIKHIEDRFNKNFHYDWVFLNDEEFTEEFKRVISAMTSGNAKFGLIPKEHWSFPDWIDKDKAAQVRKQMKEDKILYGDSISYRHMCRYESGFFWRHPILDDYKWYWRVEPDIKIYCDIGYDVFRFMEENNKEYGFILSLSEYVQTIPTLWDTTKKFMEKHPEFVHKNNMMDFISDDGGESYNMCHFWSNFEVASLDFWRGPAYRAYFDYLDKNGGFFYERWGDAPVHSIAAALFLDKKKLHFFNDIGYFHPGFTSCPNDEDVRLKNKCICNPADDHTWYTYYFCTRKFMKAGGYALPPNIEQ